MSLSNEIEELLSGYLDNQLSADELRKVELALEDRAVQARYNELKLLRDDLKLLAAMPVRGLPADFAQRVLQAAASQAAAISPAQPNNANSTKRQYRGRDAFRWAVAIAALAATVTLAIWVPQIIKKDIQPTELAQLPPDSNSTEIEPQEDPPAASGMLVARNDLRVQVIMTLDLEITEDKSIATTLKPLLQEQGIELIKGVKVNTELKKALDKVRMEVPPVDAPLPTEVYLIRAPSMTLDRILETMRADEVTYPVVRFGLSFDLPSDPLIDKLSENSSGGAIQTSGQIALSQAIANAVSQSVDADDHFAAPLGRADQEEFRASPFESIPPQGKLVGSSKRLTKTAFSLDNNEDGKFSFLLLFVRQR